MNKPEKILLQSLKEKSEDSELLSHIRKEMPDVGKLRGDPRFIAEISITVKIRYTNGGAYVAPGAINAQLQNLPIPIYLFGLTDMLGGYFNAQRLAPVSLPWSIVGTGTSLEVQRDWFPSITIPDVYHAGDFYYYFNQNIPLCNDYCRVTITCNNVAYGTFVNSFSDDLIILNGIQYTVIDGNVDQFINPLVFGYQTIFGKLKTDTIDPRIYVTNQTYQQHISNIPISLALDKNLVMVTYARFGVQDLNFILTVQKVRPLTRRF